MKYGMIVGVYDPNVIEVESELEAMMHLIQFKKRITEAGFLINHSELCALPNDYPTPATPSE